MMSTHTVIKVLIISPLPPPIGGIANWSNIILPALESAENINVIHHDTAVRWRSTNDNNILKRILGGTIQAIRDIIGIFSLLIRKKPHIIHLCTSGSMSTPKDILILAIAALLNVKSIIHYRMGRIPQIATVNTWEWKTMRIAMILADLILLLDQQSESIINISLPKLATKRIPNPIDVRLIMNNIVHKRNTSRNCPCKIIYSGHVKVSKGIIELIKACILIKEKRIELILVGKIENKFKAEILEIARQRENGEWLTILGVRNWRDTIDCVREADIFVLPSYTEGFPNVILEAMALGKPIISTRVGAISEMLDENSEQPCGLVISPRNLHELHDAIDDFIMNQEKAAAYGNRAQIKAVKYYSKEKVVNEYIEAWQSISKL